MPSIRRLKLELGGGDSSDSYSVDCLDFWSTLVYNGFAKIKNRATLEGTHILVRVMGFPMASRRLFFLLFLVMFLCVFVLFREIGSLTCGGNGVLRLGCVGCVPFLHLNTISIICERKVWTAVSERGVTYIRFFKFIFCWFWVLVNCIFALYIPVGLECLGGVVVVLRKWCQWLSN